MPPVSCQTLPLVDQTSQNIHPDEENRPWASINRAPRIQEKTELSSLEIVVAIVVPFQISSLCLGLLTLDGQVCGSTSCPA